MKNEPLTTSTKPGPRIPLLLFTDFTWSSRARIIHTDSHWLRFTNFAWSSRTAQDTRSVPCPDPPIPPARSIPPIRRRRRRRARSPGMALNGTGWQHLRRSSSPISKPRNDLGPMGETGRHSRLRQRRARSPGMAQSGNIWQHLKRVFIADLQTQKRFRPHGRNGSVHSPSATSCSFSGHDTKWQHLATFQAGPSHRSPRPDCRVLNPGVTLSSFRDRASDLMVREEP